MIVANDVIEIENAKIRFRNFSGEPEQYNSQGGNRHFTLIIDEEMAKEFRDSGFNVKVKEWEDGSKEYRIDVKMNYKGPFPPRVTLITGRSQTLLSESTVGNLDRIDIDAIDLVLRAYDYGSRMEKAPGEPHMKFYVKSMYVVQALDSFAQKYAFENDDDEVPFV